VEEDEIERFLAAVERLPELAAGELDQLNITAAPGVIDLTAAPRDCSKMLYSKTTPEQKRIKLREILASGTIQQFPGAFNPLSARLIEEKGFAGVYISGAVLANDLGLPDIGLTTLTEVATRAGQIARMTDLPCIVDADTGFGEPMNVARSVQELENAGLAGCHIEDQFNPKRCGHLDGKNVVDLDTATKRIRAAADARRDPNFLIMARTDIRATDGLQAPKTGEGTGRGRGRRYLPGSHARSARIPCHPRRRGRADPGQHDRVRQERPLHHGATAERWSEHGDLPCHPAPQCHGRR
jgi:hypothetical protein